MENELKDMCGFSEGFINCIEEFHENFQVLNDLTEKQFSNANNFMQFFTRIVRSACQNDGAELKRAHYAINHDCYDEDLEHEHNEKLTQFVVDLKNTTLDEVIDKYMSNECKLFKEIGQSVVDKLKSCQGNTEHDVLRKYINILLDEFNCSDLFSL